MKDSVQRTKELTSLITLITAIRMFLNKIPFGLLLCSLLSSCIASKEKYDDTVNLGKRNTPQRLATLEKELDELFKILESN
jgi:hypothetical protein